MQFEYPLKYFHNTLNLVEQIIKMCHVQKGILLIDGLSYGGAAVA